MSQSLRLSPQEQAMASGAQGPAVQMAMQVITGLARARGASRLIEVTGAHIDSCLYHGPLGMDFVHRLRDLGGTVRVPTTLNVGAVDLLHPQAVRTDPRLPGPPGAGAELMRAYADLGARPTYTCAPYEREARPGLGEHVAWAESNAIVFANSVLGARTDRYGDFLDICAALTARVPYAGLHRTSLRRAQMVLDCSGLPGVGDPDELFMVALGAHVGAVAGTDVVALVGLPATVSEDRLKALGAAAASTGSVALCHVVGRTPEAPTLAAVADPEVPTQEVTVAHLKAQLDALCTAPEGPVDAVLVGTPHASLSELAELARLAAAGAGVRPGLHAVVNTSRGTFALAREGGLVDLLVAAGWRVLTDTCAYLAPVLPPQTRTVATNSGKVAAYAPANLGVAVLVTSLEECVTASRTGVVRRAW